jgi:hypothetical protein
VLALCNLEYRTTAGTTYRILSSDICCGASFQGLIQQILLDHDWFRALRIASYGFLLYGPGSHVWYQFLDRCMPKQTLANLSAKVCFASSIALCWVSMQVIHTKNLLTNITISGHTKLDRAWSLCYCCDFCLEQLMVR